MISVRIFTVLTWLLCRRMVSIIGLSEETNMFTPTPNPGFNPELGRGVHFSSQETLVGFAEGETAEALICYEEHFLHAALVDICVQRAEESSSGYSASYHVGMLRRQGLFTQPLKGYQELDKYQRDQRT